MTTASAEWTIQAGKRRILVIDEEHRLANSLAALLRGQGYDVAAATDGREGLALVRKNNWDLIITDLRLDGIDGFDILREAESKRNQPSVIFMTGRISTESAIEALHQGVDDFIPKPFDFEVLRHSIDKVFARKDIERMREDMLHMLTHDIKVPLASVLGFAQMLVTREGKVHEKAPKFAELIISNSQKALGMLENYLMNARVEEGRLDIMPSPVQPRAIIENELRLYSLEIGKKELEVELDLNEVPDSFQADEPLLVRAASNLLSNAFKYTPKGGTVYTGVFHTGSTVEIIVANTGPEPSEEDCLLMFERYRRTSSSRGIEGSGLGLHVVKCVAEAHRGTVDCRYENGWTRFTLAFPMPVETS